jgi:ribosomal protein L13E
MTQRLTQRAGIAQHAAEISNLGQNTAGASGVLVAVRARRRNTHPRSLARDLTT